LLSSIVVEIDALEDSIIPMSHGRALHGMFLKVIGEKTPKIVRTLHPEENEKDIDPKIEQEKPFTLSLIHGRFKKKGNNLLLSKGNNYWFRITGIENKFSETILKLTPEDFENIHIDNCGFSVINILKTNKEHREANSTTYEALVNKYLMLEPAEAASLPDKIRLHFQSPTSFREGRRNFPLPLPDKLFNMLVSKWETYSTISFKESEQQENREILSELAKNILVSQYNLKTKMMDFGDYKIVGFVGDCEFLFRTWKRMPSYRKLLLKQWFHILCDFAFYAGVGYKTTMGMGQVRRVE
jgi:CRISPR-associated endoribonuclease Cas6